MKRFLILFYVSLCVCVFSLRADDLSDALNRLLVDEMKQTSVVSLYVYDLTDNRPVYAHNSKLRLRPASTQKLLTAVTALERMRPDDVFSTSLYFTGKVNEGVLWGDVYVKGGFDPLFGTEDMDRLVSALKLSGVDSVAGNLCADLSVKDTLQWGRGWCWDDDMPKLSALTCNGRDNFMSLFAERLNRSGVRFDDVRTGRTPPEAELIVQVRRGLDYVLEPMMKQSDNLCAEAVFYRLAAMGGKAYAQREDAVAVEEELVARLGFNPADYVIADGSGVSLYNYTSVELQVALLRYAFSKKGMFGRLCRVLPVSGVDGTLRNRLTEPGVRGKVRAKTGTVEGVSSLAGYVWSAGGHVFAFSIINQGVAKAREGRDFQDKVCRLLCR